MFWAFVLVLGLGTFGPWVNCAHTPITPPIHLTTNSRFLSKFFPRMGPQLFFVHDSPSNLAESPYPRSKVICPSDGFFFSVSETCFGNIGKQVLVPYVSVPVSCFRKEFPPTYFLPFYVVYKKKSPTKKNDRSWSHSTPRATRGWTMTMCSLCMSQLGLLNNTQRRRNIRITTSSGTTHWWTKDLL